MGDPRAPDVEDSGPELSAAQEVSLVLGQRPRDSAPDVVLVGVDVRLDADRRDLVIRVCASGLDSEQSQSTATSTDNSWYNSSYSGIETNDCLYP